MKEQNLNLVCELISNSALSYEELVLTVMSKFYVSRRTAREYIDTAAFKLKIKLK